MDLHLLSLLGESDATFVVDSDAALEAWAENDPGNDYTVVYIKGEMEIQTNYGINLASCGTYGVIGAPGSVIHFYHGDRSTLTSINGGNRNSGNYDPTKQFLVNVHITCDDEHAFYGCNNMYNCTGKADSGFQYCENLVNCKGGSQGTGFEYCRFLANCSTDNAGCGFGGCENLTNCVTNYCGHLGFGDCSKLFNCADTGSPVGFRNCRTMFGCSGTREGCYMTSATEYPAADTATGGYNY